MTCSLNSFWALLRYHLLSEPMTDHSFKIIIAPSLILPVLLLCFYSIALITIQHSAYFISLSCLLSPSPSLDSIPWSQGILFYRFTAVFSAYNSIWHLVVVQKNQIIKWKQKVFLCFLNTVSIFCTYMASHIVINMLAYIKYLDKTKEQIQFIKPYG